MVRDQAKEAGWYVSIPAWAMMSTNEVKEWKKTHSGLMDTCAECNQERVRKATELITQSGRAKATTIQ